MNLSIDNLLDVIGEVYSQKADDLCWMDIDRIFAAAGFAVQDRSVGDKKAMLANCSRFLDQLCTGKKEWPSYVDLENRIVEHVEFLRWCYQHLISATIPDNVNMAEKVRESMLKKDESNHRMYQLLHLISKTEGYWVDLCHEFPYTPCLHDNHPQTCPMCLHSELDRLKTAVESMHEANAKRIQEMRSAIPHITQEYDGKYSATVNDDFVHVKTPLEDNEKYCIVYRLPLVLLRVMKERDDAREALKKEHNRGNNQNAQ